jgi:dCTP diphosphatase
MNAPITLAELSAAVVAFRDARDWQQFHTPKNLSAALAIEAGELQETLLWKTDSQVAEALISADSREKIADELADVLAYALLFAEAAGIDPTDALLKKLAKNDAKYPVEWARGSIRKYTERTK